MVRRRQPPLEMRAEILSLLTRIRSIVYLAWVREQGDIPLNVLSNLRRGERIIAEADSEIHPQFPPATYYLISPPEQEFYLPMRWIIRIRTTQGGDAVLEGNSGEPERNDEDPERNSEDSERDGESEWNA